MSNPLTLEVLSGNRGHYTRDTWADPMRLLRDSFSRLYVLEDGEARLWLDSVEHVLAPGNLYLIPAGRSGHYVCPEHMVLCWLHIRAEVLPLVDMFSRWSPPDVGVPLPAGALRAMGEILALRTLPDSPENTLRTTALICGLLAHFVPTNWDAMLPPAGIVDRFRPALELMQQSMDKSLRLADLAQTAHLHPTYFSNLFKTTFGVSPVAYHMQLRLHRAKMLLINTASPVSEVAASCGFADEFNFSKTFKRHTRISPTVFRKGGTVAMP